MGACGNREPKMVSNRDNKENEQVSKESQETEIRFNPGPMKCPQNNEIVSMCISPECMAQALSCSNPACSTCSKLHPGCTQIPLSQEVTHMIKSRTEYHRTLTKKMKEIETRMAEEMIRRRKGYFESLFKKGNERYVSIIDAIYFKKNDVIIQGREAQEFYQKLKETNARIRDVQTELLRDYEDQIKKQVESIVQLQINMLDKYAQKCTIEFKDNSRFIKKGGQQPSLINLQPNSLQLNSKIIKKTDTDALAFISESLNSPKTMKLLYRGSEQGFKAEKFHELCDDKKHTFTLIQTEFDKIVGGYTPLTWNGSSGFGHDKSEKSCLLSIDLMEKMSLVRPEKAIQCIPTYGPVFGGGADIAISDSCHQNNHSCVNFAYSYNCHKKYGYNQLAWKALCGVEDGKYFKVKEYEVFQLSWNE